MKAAALNALIIVIGVAIGDHFFNDGQITAFVLQELRGFGIHL